MWNLERTEERIHRLTPIIVLIVLLLLAALHLTLEPRKLAPAFNSALPAAQTTR